MDWILTNPTWGNTIYTAVIWIISSIILTADYFLRDRFPKTSEAATYIFTFVIIATPFYLGKVEFLIPTAIGYIAGIITYWTVSKFKLFPFKIIKNIASRDWKD
ncbi:hypothetical protein ACFL24_00580 [Patescibacteria group bacterium]